MRRLFVETREQNFGKYSLFQLRISFKCWNFYRI